MQPQTNTQHNNQTQTSLDSARGKCLNCGAELYGSYCYNCGQKVIEHKDRSVGTYIRNFFEEAFSFDAKFLKTMKLLLIKPGFLTLEYVEGRVNRYTSPIKLYLFISVVSFFIGSLISADTLQEFVDNYNAKDFVTNYVSHTGVSYEVFEAKYNSQLEGKLPLYFMGLVILFSLPLKMIYLTTKRYYVEHLVFSVHFFSFLLVMAVISTILELLIPDITLFFFFVLPFVYLLIAVKTAYRQKFVLSFFETIILFIYYTVLLLATVVGAFFVTLLLV